MKMKEQAEGGILVEATTDGSLSEMRFCLQTSYEGCVPARMPQARSPLSPGPRLAAAFVKELLAT